MTTKTKTNDTILGDEPWEGKAWDNEEGYFIESSEKGPIISKEEAGAYFENDEPYTIPIPLKPLAQKVVSINQTTISKSVTLGPATPKDSYDESVCTCGYQKYNKGICPQNAGCPHY